MTDPEGYLTSASYLMTELGGLGYATDSEEEFNRAVYSNCLKAIEQTAVAGIAEKGGGGSRRTGRTDRPGSDPVGLWRHPLRDAQ